jgi:hypothetical protein
MSSFGLTQINVTLLEALDKLNRISKIHEITRNFKNHFKFPENTKLRSDSCETKNIKTEPLSSDECEKIVEKAILDAKNICESLGMENLDLCNPEEFFKHSEPKENADGLSQYIEERFGNRDDEDEEEEDEIEEKEEEEEFLNGAIDISGYNSGSKKILRVKNLFFIDEDSRKKIF